MALVLDSPKEMRSHIWSVHGRCELMNAQDADGMERDCTYTVTIDGAAVDEGKMAQPMRVLRELRAGGMFHVNQLVHDIAASLERFDMSWAEQTSLKQERRLAPSKF